MFLLFICVEIIQKSCSNSSVFKCVQCKCMWNGPFSYLKILSYPFVAVSVLEAKLLLLDIFGLNNNHTPPLRRGMIIFLFDKNGQLCVICRSFCPSQSHLSISFDDLFYLPRDYTDLTVDSVRLQNTLRFGIQVWPDYHTGSHVIFSEKFKFALKFATLKVKKFHIAIFLSHVEAMWL